MNDPNVIYGGDFQKWSELKAASLGALVIKHLQARGGSEKLFINGTTDEAWSRNEVLEKCIKIAKSLYGVGIRHNDMISIVSENCHDYIAIAFGVFCLNAVIAPVNNTYTQRELRHAFDVSKPKIVFVSKETVKNVAAVCADLSYVQKIIIIDGKTDNKVTSLNDFIELNSRIDFDVYEHVKKSVKLSAQSAVIFLSSGTTGNPKGVDISQSNVMDTFRSYVEARLEILKTADPIRVLVISPCSHVMGFFGIMFFLLHSDDQPTIFFKKFELKLFLSCIERYKISVISVAPPILVMMAKSPLLNDFDVSSLRILFSGAAPLSKETEDQVKTRLKGRVEIFQGYGMSEMTYGILGSYERYKPGSAGKILKGDYVKVIDANGKSLPANKVGELCFKGHRIMKGYLNNPKATAETIDKDGWLHTGDLGYYDDDQEFYVVDRLKELIKYKGFQVPPAELEGLLLSNPKVKDCGVIGIADEDAGELPFAFVVNQPGEVLSEDEVKDFIKKNASNAKWLRGGVKFIDDIPKNPSGKILRRKLRELFKSMKSKL